MYSTGVIFLFFRMKTVGSKAIFFFCVGVVIIAFLGYVGFRVYEQKMAPTMLFTQTSSEDLRNLTTDDWRVFEYEDFGYTMREDTHMSIHDSRQHRSCLAMSSKPLSKADVRLWRFMTIKT